MPAKFEGARRKDAFAIDPSQVVPSRNLRFGGDGESDVGDLAKSIAANGQLQPVVVERGEEGAAVLVCGYRRVAAIKKINANLSEYGLEEPLEVLAVQTRPENALLLNLTENLDRRSLSPMDKAVAAAALSEQGMTHREIGDNLRCTSASVGNYLFLLELPREAQHRIHHGMLKLKDALAFRGLDDEDVLAAMASDSPGQKAKQRRRAKGEKLQRSWGDVKTFLECHCGALGQALVAFADGDNRMSESVLAPLMETASEAVADQLDDFAAELEEEVTPEITETVPSGAEKGAK